MYVPQAGDIIKVRDETPYTVTGTSGWPWDLRHPGGGQGLALRSPAGDDCAYWLPEVSYAGGDPAGSIGGKEQERPAGGLSAMIRKVGRARSYDGTIPGRGSRPAGWASDWADCWGTS